MRPTLDGETYEEIFGYVPVVYVRQARLGRTWVVKVGVPYEPGRLSYDDQALGFRSYERALAEADYQARLARWKAAYSQRWRHICSTCEFGSHVHRLRCANNPSNTWLEAHEEPQPPEA